MPVNGAKEEEGVVFFRNDQKGSGPSSRLDRSVGTEDRRERNGLDRRRFLAGASLACVAPFETALGVFKRPPNFLFIMADDLGWADLGCYGRDDIATPNIDELARQGLRFTDAYSNSSVCSPTRVALITGRYQYHLPAGIMEEPIRVHSDLELPSGAPTMPGLLRTAGYRTSLVGKWHLGGIRKSGPLQHGYERFWGIRSGGVDYFRHSFITDDAEVHDLWDGDTEVHEVGYLTNLLGARASDEIRTFAQTKQPFLLSLHFTAPHWPWETEEDRKAAIRHKRISTDFEYGSMRTYGAMVETLDANVGQVLRTLERNGVADNTVVIFTSDNGGERFSKTWPFSGMKGELLEGGIRVPMIVRWPGIVAEGSETGQTALSMDWLATMLDIIRVPQRHRPPLDGESLLATLAGGEERKRKLFWRYNAHGQKAMREGPWKYISIGGHEYLFNVADDPQERANLKNRKNERFKHMKAEWAAWNSGMLPYPDDARSWSNKTNGVFPDRY